MVGSDGPEEGQARCESIDVQSGTHTGTEVLQTVGQGVSQFNVCRCTGFLHVVTGDGDRIELGHVLGSIFEDIGNNLHGECWRVDVSVAHHEFLQDIVLDGTGHFFQLGALLQSGVNVEGHNRKNGTVHGHGH